MDAAGRPRPCGCWPSFVGYYAVSWGGGGGGGDERWGLGRMAGGGLPVDLGSRGLHHWWPRRLGGWGSGAWRHKLEFLEALAHGCTPNFCWGFAQVPCGVVLALAECVFALGRGARRTPAFPSFPCPKGPAVAASGGTMCCLQVFRASPPLNIQPPLHSRSPSPTHPPTVKPPPPPQP